MTPPLPRIHEVNPACVEQFTSLTIIQRQMLEEMRELKIAVKGNGKPGLIADLGDLKDEHEKLEHLVTEYINAQKKEAEEKKADARDTGKEYLKWRLGIAAVVIAGLVTTALGVFQSYLVAQLVANIK